MSSVGEQAVIWHEAETGGYVADLPLWAELAAARPGPILELGCGTGRVALDLARRGHEVVGVDTEAVLVSALAERAGERGARLDALVADARDLRGLDSAGRKDRFGLILAPMQMFQLLADRSERAAALRAASERLASGGLVAIAIVEGEPADTADDSPLPDVTERDGFIYSSMPLSVTVEAGQIDITRLRQIVSPEGNLSEEVNRMTLALLDAAALEREAAEVGLSPAGRRSIPATEWHMGSTVVLLEGGAR